MLPAGSAGMFAVMVVELSTTTPVAGTPPALTVAPGSNARPRICAPMTPVGDPDTGSARHETRRKLGGRTGRARGGGRDRRSIRDDDREDLVEGTVAGPVGRDLDRADVSLRLVLLLRAAVARGVGVEVEVEGGRRRAVERTGDRRIRASVGHRRDQRIILVAVRPAVRVSGVVDVDPQLEEVASGQIDREAAVGLDPGVVEDRVAAHGGIDAVDHDTRKAPVVRDDVPLARADAADGRVRPARPDSPVAVGQADGARAVGSDLVALDDGSVAVDIDSGVDRSPMRLPAPAAEPPISSCCRRR